MHGEMLGVLLRSFRRGEENCDVEVESSGFEGGVGASWRG